MFRCDGAIDCTGNTVGKKQEKRKKRNRSKTKRHESILGAAKVPTMGGSLRGSN